MTSNAPEYFTTSSSLLDSKIWHPIPGHRHHFISRSGAVMSLKRSEPRLLRPFVNQTGTHQVDLDGVRYSIGVLLRLVFQPNRSLISETRQ